MDTESTDKWADTMNVSPVRRPYGLAHIHAGGLVPLDESTPLTRFKNPLSYEGDGLRTVPQLQHLEYAAIGTSDHYLPPALFHS